LQFDQQNTLTQDQLYRAHRAVGEGIMVGRFVIKDELREIKRRELGQRGSARIKKKLKKNSDAQLDCTTPGAYDCSSPPGCHSDQLVLCSNGRGGGPLTPNGREPKCCWSR
jgi:hypothetical protein